MLEETASMPSWLMIYARLSLVGSLHLLVKILCSIFSSVLVRSRRLAKLRRRYSPSSAARQLIRRRRLSRPYSSEPSSPKQPQHSHRDSNFGTDNKGPTAFVIGSVAGMAGSLVGMGGAFISLPLMTGVLRMTQHQAHATSLAAVAACGTGGALGFISSGNVDWAAAAAIATSGMISARIGARFAGSLDGAVLKKLFGLFNMLIAPSVLLKSQLVTKILAFFPGAFLAHLACFCRWLLRESQALGWEEKPSQQEEDREKNGRRNRQGKDARVGASSDNKNGFPPAMHLMAMAGIGATTGGISGLFGVGGGSITVPAVALVSDFSHYKVLGTSLAAMILPAMSGVATHHQAGRVVWPVALPLAAGSAIGCYLGGRHVALRVDEDVLRIIFFGLMVGIGGRTFAAARHAVIFK